ncbi:NAD(P)-binding protein [Coniochaeta ligniaria NRRL 30616]|uniref:NAD(P)-binding protein n=1 Tax=Coniochaeta ligniaria NRRL 30616 TaxID=1408157 RepID=A0A1J7J442_9PEZI|nr:NAD(P)-binding protein [Coniochaeta ligniaria NRRL 30616]
MSTVSLPSTMRAAQWSKISGGLESSLKPTTAAKFPKGAQPLGATSTLVKVAYAAINPVDYKLAELPVVNRFLFGRTATPGLDFAGTVVSTNLAHLKPGQRVFGQAKTGSLAEYAVVEKGSIAPLPDNVSFRDAATIGVAGLTAYQCIAPYVKPGAKVLVNGGSGGVGTFVIQAAKAAGASTVTAICSGPNAELCKSLGADEVIDYRAENPVAALKRSGRQYDHVVDTVFHSADMYWNCHHYLKPHGIYVSIAGNISPRGMWDLVSVSLWPKWLGGGQRKFFQLMEKPNPRDYELVAQWMSEGKIKPVVEEEFALEDAGKAFARLKTGRTRGKLVVRVAGE